VRAEEETHNSDPLNLARARNSHGAAVTRLCIRVVRLAQRWKGHRCPLVKALKAWQAPLRLAEHSYSGVGMPTRRCTRREGTSRLPLRLSDDKEEPRGAQSRPYSSIPSPLFTRVQQRCAQACGRGSSGVRRLAGVLCSSAIAPRAALRALLAMEEVSWFRRYTRWRQTSRSERKEAERQLLSCAAAGSTPVRAFDTRVGSGERDVVHALECGVPTDPPLLLLPGYGAGAAFFW